LEYGINLPLIDALHHEYHDDEHGLGNVHALSVRRRRRRAFSSEYSSCLAAANNDGLYVQEKAFLETGISPSNKVDSSTRCSCHHRYLKSKDQSNVKYKEGVGMKTGALSAFGDDDGLWEGSSDTSDREPSLITCGSRHCITPHIISYRLNHNISLADSKSIWSQNISSPSNLANSINDAGFAVNNSDITNHMISILSASWDKDELAPLFPLSTHSQK
jgi:hypothetical protein